METTLFPAGASEQVDWSKAGVLSGTPIEDIHSPHDALGPELGVGHFGPMDGTVQHVAPSN